MPRRAVELDALSAPSIAGGDVELPASKIRILIVSDVRFYREALASRLGQNERREVVDTVDPDGALAVVIRRKPHLVLLDIGEWHGLERATALLREQPDLEILAIGVPEIAVPAFSTMGPGFVGCVPRDGSIDDVIAQVDRLTAWSSGESISVAPDANDNPGPGKPILTSNSRGGDLTRRECEILQMIELGLSNKEIARDLEIEVGTVKNHVHNILEKLNVRGRNQAAHHLRARHPRQHGPV
jgi:two-component system, NarL family, nitrate/nitrite response regulator NarL